MRPATKRALLSRSITSSRRPNEKEISHGRVANTLDASRWVLSLVFEVQPQYRIAERCDSDFPLRRPAQMTWPKQKRPQRVKAFPPNFVMRFDRDPATPRTRTASAEHSASPGPNSLTFLLLESAFPLSQFQSKFRGAEFRAVASIVAAPLVARPAIGRSYAPAKCKRRRPR